MKEIEKLVKIIFETAEAKGDKPKDIADKIGVPKSTIYRIKNGTVSPSTATLERLMIAYNIKLS